MDLTSYVEPKGSPFHCPGVTNGRCRTWPDQHCLPSNTAKHLMPSQVSELHLCCTPHQDCSPSHLPFILLTIISHSGELLHILQNPIQRPFFAGHLSWHLMIYPHPSIPGSVRRATASYITAGIFVLIITICISDRSFLFTKSYSW